MAYIYRENVSNLAIISDYIRENEKPLGEIERDEFNKLCEQNIGKHAIVQDDGSIIWSDTYTRNPELDLMDEIENAKKFLADTDNYALRLATGESKPEDWSDTYSCTLKEIMDKRSNARKLFSK